MLIVTGADHGGFALKEKLKTLVRDLGYEVFDVGASALIPGDDYPAYAAAVGAKVAESPEGSRGILVCRSGVGVDIVANKFHGVRSVLGQSPDHVYQARHDDDVNVLSIAADFTDESAARNMVKIFIETPFGKDDRYARRIKEIEEIENGGAPRV
jgi:RpiB/LacA/LacB family sugar-phosphate isomerase